MERIIANKKILVTAAFLISVIITGSIIISGLVSQKNRNIERASYVLESEISKLKYSIESRMMDTDILEMIVVNNGGEINDFNKIAENLYSNDSSIRSIQLAPDGVVSYIYPIEGNEEAGGDLFVRPERKTEAEYARNSGETTLAGPFELVQGGTGMVARNPIYIKNENGEEIFWGFSIIVLNVPEIFFKADIENLSRQGYSYRIWRNNPDTGDKQIIYENIKNSYKNPLEREIDIPNGKWVIGIYPSDGWIPYKNVVFRILIGLVICILECLTVYGFVTMEEQKRALAVLANTDPLTGIHNGRYMAAVLKELVRAQTPFGLLYMDLNRFKQVNDSYGHDIGDCLLTEVTVRIKKCIKTPDMAFRIGGDEFAVIIRGKNNRDFYEDVRKRIENEVSRPYVVGSVNINPEISCGYSLFPDDQTTVDELMKLADQRMYKVKREVQIK